MDGNTDSLYHYKIVKIGGFLRFSTVGPEEDATLLIRKDLYTDDFIIESAVDDDDDSGITWFNRIAVNLDDKETVKKVLDLVRESNIRTAFTGFGVSEFCKQIIKPIE